MSDLDLFQIHNRTIESLSLDMPSGCLGECEWYFMKVSRSGALEYRGIANMPVLGNRTGRVSRGEFDLIASVVESTGFLDLSEEDDGPERSTSGDKVIGVTFLNGQERTFSRDVVNEPPIFWAVAKLIGALLNNVEWDESEYE